MKRLTLTLLIALGAQAQADEMERRHGSHSHGAAQLDIAIDGPVLEARLLSPAINLVGFEHRAVAADERQRVEQAVATLEQGYEMLRLSEAALCLLDRAEVEQALLDTGAAGHDGHGEHEHEHEHEHEQEQEQEQEHGHEGDHDEHDHAGDEPNAHADFEVSYRFRCARPDKLDGMSVELFHHFPGLESLRVQFIGAGQQGLTLTSNQTRIEF
ncbi:DUF2796 domain-containing protein [Marinobacterium aestuariivivens]|uniref:DUF2796 domain-containing protein n=1 Tax=Marinobacterium aestuariivivens TaxID=1698799 RepID=A0ABW1ZUT3_9GAMM